MTPAAAGSPRWARGRGHTPGRLLTCVLAAVCQWRLAHTFTIKWILPMRFFPQLIARIVILHKQQLNPEKKG